MTSLIVFITTKIESILLHGDLGLLSFKTQHCWPVPEICILSILFRKRVAPGEGLEEGSHSPRKIVASSLGDVQLHERQEEIP